MTDDQMDPTSGISVIDWIEAVPTELDQDAIGLWQIVGMLKHGYKLSGEELTYYVRKCILLVLAEGAIPVVGDESGKRTWNPKEGCGSTPEEMADFIIDEWISSGLDPYWGDVWFSLPDGL